MQIRISLYIFVILALVITKGLKAQNYADSTIVYLQWESDPLTSMVINWIDTPSLNSAQIQYRRRGTNSWISASADSIPIPDSNVYRYKYEATGLQSGTNFEFRLLSDNVVQLFRTMPDDLSGGVNFMVTGDVYGDGTDSAFDTNAFQLISRYATTYYPFFAVLAGDLVHLNSANEYNENTLNRIFKFLSEWTKNMKTPNGLHIPIVSAYGNHELPQRFGGSPADAVYFNALFSFPGLRGYERLDFSDYLSLIVLNTDHTARIEGAQTIWLEDQLQNTQNFKNVFPIYHVSGYPGFRDPLPGRGLEVKEFWSPLFDEYNVSFVFEHDRHEYKRTVPITDDAPDACGVRYVGGGGYAIITGGEDLGKWYIEKFSDQRHFVRVELTNTKRAIQTIAFNGAEIDYYEESSVLPPPSLLASSSIKSNGFNLNWQVVCDAVNYRVDISTDSNFSTFVPGFDGKSVGAVTRLEVTGLNPLTRYYYRIRSVNAAGQTSTYSPSESVTTVSDPPIAQAATQVSSVRFTANWAQVDGVTNYEIDVSKSINFTSFVGQYEAFEVGNQSSLQISGLNSATPYYYRIRAKNRIINRKSGNSNTVGVITLPDPPTEFEILEQASNRITLSWNESPRVDQYLIDVATDASFNNFIYGYDDFVTLNNEITVEGLEPLNIYYIRGRSRNLEYNVTSILSESIAVSTTGIPPIALSGTNTTRSSFIANWETAPSASSYLLEVSTDELFIELIPGYDNLNVGQNLNYEVTGLISGVRYYYRVKALNTTLGLASESSNVISVFTTPDTPVILAPSEVLSRSFKANWQKVARIDLYLVDVSTTPNFETYLDGWNDRLISSDTSVVIDGLSPNSDYYYRVRAISSDQSVTSDYSMNQSVITILDGVSEIEVSEVTSTTIGATWSDTENAEEYLIDVSIDPDFGTFVSDYNSFSNGSSNQVVIDNLEPVTQYFIRVKASARDGFVEGDYSPTEAVLTLPKTPDLFVASEVKAEGFSATWSIVENVTSYQLEIATDESFTQVYKNYSAFDVGNVSEYVLRDVLPGTTLFYRVRSINSTLNLFSVWSEIQSVTTIAIDPLRSAVELSKDRVLSDGFDFSEIKVTILGENSILLDEIAVVLSAQSGDSQIEVLQDVTDSSGIALFRVRNEKAEFVVYTVTAIQTDLASNREVAFVPIPPTPALASSILASSFIANWEPVNGANSYRIDVSTSESFSSFVDGYEDLSVENNNTVLVSGLFPGDRYYYRVRAVASTGISMNSEIIEVVTPEADPTLSSITTDKSSILANNEEVSNVTVTVLDFEGQPMSGVPVRMETSDTNSTIEVISGLTDENGIAEFRITSNFAGQVFYTVFAGRVEVNTKAEINFVPLAPNLTISTPYSTDEITLQWNKLNGVTDYLLDVSIDSTFATQFDEYESFSMGDLNLFRVNSLSSATKYYFRIRSATQTAISNFSNIVSNTTLPLNPIAIDATDIESRSFTANWTSVDRIDVYLLDVSSDSLFRMFIPDFRNRVIDSSLSSIVDDLSPNATYFYRLRGAIIEDNVIGGYSNTIRVVTVLDAPENVSAVNITPDAITFEWDEAENAEEYFIDLALDPQFNETVNGFVDYSAGSETSIQLNGLFSSSAYYFRVRSSGRNNTNTSDYSTVISVNTIPETPDLNPPTLVKAIGFTATWAEVERINFYEFDVAYDEEFTQIYGSFNNVNVGNVSELTLIEILPGTTLYYRVRAVSTTLQVFSEWSEVQQVTTTAIDPVTSTVIASKEQILADGSEFSQITVTVRDASSIPLESVSVQLEALSGDSEIEVLESVTGTNGVALFRVSNRKAEYVTFRATAIETVLNSEPEIAFTPVAPEAESATRILGSSFLANWSPVNGASSYRVDVSSNASFSSFVEGYNDVEVIQITQLQVEGLFPGDEYYYRIRAIAPTGTSQNSNVISLETIQADPVLTGVQVSQANILSDGLTKGVVSVTVSGTNGQPMFGVPVRLETSDTHSTIEIVSGLSDENGHAEFEVTSDFAGLVTYTVFAGRVEVNTKAEINFIPMPPVARFPTLLGAVEFTAVWEKVNGATHYLLDVASDPDFENLISPYTALNVGDINEIRVLGLTPGITYYYRVRGATPTATGEYSNTINVTTYQIDLVNSTAIPSSHKILANGEQKTEVEIKLINEDGDPLSDVLVQLIPDESVYTIESVQDITDSDGIAKFNLSSLVAGEGVFTVSAGGLELESKVEVIFLFADGEIKLGYNFPNPFGSITRIPITVPERMNVTIDVYNSFGQRVAELESKEFLAGYYEIPFIPRGLSSGVYIVRMIADGKVHTQKMMFIK